MPTSVKISELTNLQRSLDAGVIPVITEGSSPVTSKIPAEDFLTNKVSVKYPDTRIRTMHTVLHFRTNYDQTLTVLPLLRVEPRIPLPSNYLIYVMNMKVHSEITFSAAALQSFRGQDEDTRGDCSFYEHVYILQKKYDPNKPSDNYVSAETSRNLVAINNDNTAIGVVDPVISNGISFSNNPLPELLYEVSYNRGNFYNTQTVLEVNAKIMITGSIQVQVSESEPTMDLDWQLA